MSKRLFVVAAVLATLALFAAAFFVAPAVRSVVAGPSASPDAPNPGHAWSEVEGHGIDGGDYWLGTTVDQALELQVDGDRALRLEPHATSPNLIGGYSGNDVTDGAMGATIGGGGYSGRTNRVTDDYGTIGGGVNNQAGDNAGSTSDQWHATVSGGGGNVASAQWSTVAGGQQNTASAWGATVSGGEANAASEGDATVGGGQFNIASGEKATVGGGGSNTASGPAATVGGGVSNTASGFQATIGGGVSNTVGLGESPTVSGGGYNEASASYATVGGGQHNIASGWGTTVPGGEYNTASAERATIGGGTDNTASGWYATVAGGEGNVASAANATVGGGYGNMASGTQATVGGGESNTANMTYATVPGGYDNEASGWYSFAAGRRAKANNTGCFVWGDSTDANVTCSNNDRFIVRASGGVYLYTNSTLTSGCWLAAGSNSWSCFSDRNLKQNFTLVDGQEVLASLAEMPITAWNLKGQDPSIRHIGPMAQDFYAAFGLSADELYISPIDTDGVALAAIQGLYEIVQDQDARIDALEARVAALEGGAEASDGSAGPLFSVMPFGPLLLAGLFLGGLVLVQRRRAGGRS